MKRRPSSKHGTRTDLIVDSADSLATRRLQAGPTVEARVAHLIVYTLGLPIFRTLAFTVGFLAQAVLALAIFKVV